MTDQINDKSKNNYYMIHRRSYPDGWDTYTINVFANMVAYADSSGKCFATQETIAKDCGMSVSTVKNCIKYLLKHDCIKDLTPNKRYYKIYGVADQNFSGISRAPQDFEVITEPPEDADGGHHVPSKSPPDLPKSPPDFEGTTGLRGHGTPTETKDKVNEKENLNEKDILRSNDRIPRTPMIFSGNRTPVGYANNRRITKPNTQPDTFIPEDDPIGPEAPKKLPKSSKPHEILFSVFQDIAQSMPAVGLGKNVKEFIKTYEVTSENVNDVAESLRNFYAPETGSWYTAQLDWNKAGTYHHNRPTAHQIVLDFSKIDASLEVVDEFTKLHKCLNAIVGTKGDVSMGLTKNFWTQFKDFFEGQESLVAFLYNNFTGMKWALMRFPDGSGGETGEYKTLWVVTNSTEKILNHEAI